MSVELNCTQGGQSSLLSEMNSLTRHDSVKSGLELWFAKMGAR